MHDSFFFFNSKLVMVKRFHIKILVDVSTTTLKQPEKKKQLSSQTQDTGLAYKQVHQEVPLTVLRVNRQPDRET